MINTRPTDCNCCMSKNSVIYGKMEEFQIRRFESGYCYICTKCGAYVGTHKGRVKDALGILSDEKTRKMRILCHQEFDKHYMRRASKSAVYYRLAQEMKIPFDDCHFGYMDYCQLEKALNIMKQWGDEYYVR